MADAIYVDDHGGVGDGTTIDSLAVQAAINAAGPGGTVRFTSGKTYLIDTKMWLQARQTVDYNGATIKRAPQAKTTLTAAFDDDSTPADVVLPVADTSAFRVGQYVTLVLPVLRQRTAAEAAVHGAGQITMLEDAENPYAAEIVQHRIVSKTATTLTVTTDTGGFFGSSFTSTTGVTEYPIGAEVLTTHIVWQLNGDDPGAEICGPGVHDGGTSAHDSGASGSTANGYQVRGRRWETSPEISCFGDHCHFHDIEFVDLPSDGIIVGGRGTVVERCTFTNVGGNATHFSSGDDTRIDTCFVYGANRVWIEHDGLAAPVATAAAAGHSIASKIVRGTVGHENGAYAWSLYCERAHLTNCYAEDAMMLFSPLYHSLDDEGTISLCTGKDCTLGFHLYTASAWQGADVIIDRVRLYDCGPVVIGRASANAPFTQSQVRTTLLDCELVNTRLDLHYTHQFRMTGGRIRHDNPSSVPTASVTVLGGSDIEFRTEIDGARFGLYASGLIDGLTIACRFRRIHHYAISVSDLDAASTRVLVTGCEALIADYLATDTATSTTAPDVGATFCFMKLGVAENNRVRMTKGRRGFFFADGPGAIVRNNVIETNPGIPVGSVRIFGGGGHGVIDNLVVKAVEDDVARGASAGAAVSASGGTPGNGAVGSLTADSLALTGVYQVVIIAAAANGGTFIVHKPDGSVDGTGVVGTPYNGSINFTLADGSTDFVAGDRIPVTVTGNTVEGNRTMTYTA